MLNKVFIILLATLVYIYLNTLLFELCLNKASSTALTTIGVLLIITLTWLYVLLIYRLLKKRPLHYD